MTIYKEITETKSGHKIPVFLSGRTMESRYNPVRDAENLLKTINDAADYFLVLGTGSGIFIKLLADKYPHAKILCLELYEEDLAFLSQLESIKELKKNPDILFTSLKQLEQNLIQTYLPARYGNIKIIEEKAWLNENSRKIAEINSVLQKTLGIISADFSVQAHFGKIWLSNIINNSKLAEKNNTSLKEVFTPDSLKKIAVIIAAGPSLDKNIFLLSKREHYFIISTDTASQSLIKNKIIPDIIVSIDGQSVSSNHFILSDAYNTKNILYAFDLCANDSAARHMLEGGNKVSFFCSGHPLASAINISCGSPLPFLFSGAGTVTITAVDLAIQAGFEKILILGADFSYSDGKAYTSGSYLDSLYNKNSTKLSGSEQNFSKLMYRTELISLCENIKTTEILRAYKKSLEEYLTSKNVSFNKADDIYELKPLDIKASSFETIKSAADFTLKPFSKKLSELKPEETEILLLPYIAWLRNNPSYKNYTYNELVKLAFNTIVSYNI